MAANNVNRRETLVAGLMAGLPLPKEERLTLSTRSVGTDAGVTGLNPLTMFASGDGDVSAALQRAFDAAVQKDDRNPAITRLPRGHWSIGNTQLVLDGRAAGLTGQGIAASFLHSVADAGDTALTLRNFGGNTENFCLDSGLPSTTPVAARATPRNGIWFDWFGGQGTIRSVEARWFNGFGMRFSTVWDSILENIIVIGCGNDEVYAVEFVSDRDTTNHTNINRLQVENSHGRAILFDRSCLNMCIDNIHCEGTIGRAGQYAIALLGTAMSYRNARIANNGGNVEILLGGAGNVYDRFSVEAGILVDYATGANGRSERSFISHSIIDRLRVPSYNHGMLVVSDCTIESLDVADQMQSVIFVRCIIGAIVLRGNQTDVMFDNCNITGAWIAEGNPVVRVHNCRLICGPAGAVVHLINCRVRDSYTTSFNQQVYSVDCTFENDLILSQSGARMWLSGRFQVAGKLAHGTGEAFGACSSDGVVAGTVHPNWYGTGGSWPAGTSRARPDAGHGDSPFARFDGRRWSTAPPLN